jgi:hypothetical protein
MAELLTLTAPQTFPSITDWRMKRIDKDIEEQYILLVARANTGVLAEAMIRGTLAVTLIRALNKANNTVKSEERRALEYLRDNGFLAAGAVAGSPD